MFEIREMITNVYLYNLYLVYSLNVILVLLFPTFNFLVKTVKLVGVFLSPNVNMLCFLKNSNTLEHQIIIIFIITYHVIKNYIKIYNEFS